MMNLTVTSATRKASEKKRNTFENSNEEDINRNVSNTSIFQEEEKSRNTNRNVGSNKEIPTAIGNN